MAIHYNMRGKDANCVSLTYREWSVSGAPDETGAQYTDGYCGVSLNLEDIIVLSMWDDNINDQPDVIGSLTTTGVTDGYFGYLSSADTVSLTDADLITSSRVFGVNNGTVGTMIVSDVVLAANFTTIGGMPAIGAPVYLAPGTEEVSAAGKATATKPTIPGQVVAEVGIVMNNANYASAKTCKILLQVKAPIQL